MRQYSLSSLEDRMKGHEAKIVADIEGGRAVTKGDMDAVDSILEENSYEIEEISRSGILTEKYTIKDEDGRTLELKNLQPKNSRYKMQPDTNSRPEILFQEIKKMLTL